jgi:hypothetical protein
MKFFSAHDGPHVHNGEVETNFAIIDSIIFATNGKNPSDEREINAHRDAFIFLRANKKNNQGGIRPRARINHYASTPQLFGARKVRIDRASHKKHQKPQTPTQALTNSEQTDSTQAQRTTRPRPHRHATNISATNRAEQSRSADRRHHPHANGFRGGDRGARYAPSGKRGGREARGS